MVAQLPLFPDGYVPYAYFLFLAPPESMSRRLRRHEQTGVRLILPNSSISVSYLHISMPWFRIAQGDIPSTENLLQQVGDSKSSFSIEVNGFDHFDTHTIYWSLYEEGHVQQLSSSCCNALFNNNGPEITPHLTVVKGLSKWQFRKLWNNEYALRNGNPKDGFDTFSFSVDEFLFARAEIDVDATKRSGRLIRTTKWEILNRFKLRGAM